MGTFIPSSGYDQGWDYNQNQDVKDVDGNLVKNAIFLFNNKSDAEKNIANLGTKSSTTLKPYGYSQYFIQDTSNIKGWEDADPSKLVLPK